MHLTGSSAAALKVLDRVPDEPQFDHLYYWWEPLELTRQFEKGIGFLQRHKARAIEEGNGGAVLELSRRIAEFEAWWTGSLEPLREFQLSVKNDPLATPGLNARLLFTMQEYAGALEEMDATDTGSDPYAYDPVTLMIYRGIALRESGNVQMARSYFLNSFKSLPESGYVFQTIPAFGNAALSYLNAVVGNKDEALDAAGKSESFMDPSRNLPLYFLSNGMLASGFVELGEIDRACQKFELLLSGPTGSSTGRVLVEFRNPVLFQDPRFQAVIRKHADQLKDPAILDEYFGNAAE
jgi:tetratricopeptide (TPR) repeat protein